MIADPAGRVWFQGLIRSTMYERARGLLRDSSDTSARRIPILPGPVTDARAASAFPAGTMIPTNTESAIKRPRTGSGDRVGDRGRVDAWCEVRRHDN